MIGSTHKTTTILNKLLFLVINKSFGKFDCRGASVATFPFIHSGVLVTYFLAQLQNQFSKNMHLFETELRVIEALVKKL